MGSKVLNKEYPWPQTGKSVVITANVYIHSYHRHFTTFAVRIRYIISRIRLELVYPIDYDDPLDDPLVCPIDIFPSFLTGENERPKVQEMPFQRP